MFFTENIILLFCIYIIIHISGEVYLNLNLYNSEVRIRI